VLRRGGLREAGTVFGGNVLARALGFLFPLLLVHAVSKPDFATVSFFTGTGFFAASLILNSLPVALTRHLAADGADPAGPHQPWLASALLGGFPVILVAIVIGEGLAVAVGEPAGLMTIMVTGLCLDAYYWGLMRGLGRFRLLVGYRAAANALQLALLAIVLGAGIGGVTIAIVIFAYVYVVPMLVIELWKHPIRTALEGRGRPTRHTTLRLLRFAGPTLVNGLAYAVFIQADVFFVRLLDQNALGDYAIAKTLSQPITLVSFAIGVVILPRVARAASAAEQRRLLKPAIGFAAGFGLVVAAVYPLIDGFLVDHLLPKSYAPAADVLPRLVAGLAVLGIYSVLSEWWVGTGRPFLPAVTLGLGAAVTIGLQLLLTPRHGGQGAALALGGGALVALLLLGAFTLLGHEREPVAQPA
jgi:O-antigen/teichoic acid export membrane protein